MWSSISFIPCTTSHRSDVVILSYYIRLHPVVLSPFSLELDPQSMCRYRAMLSFRGSASEKYSCFVIAFSVHHFERNRIFLYSLWPATLILFKFLSCCVSTALVGLSLAISLSISYLSQYFYPRPPLIGGVCWYCHMILDSILLFCHCWSLFSGTWFTASMLVQSSVFFHASASHCCLTVLCISFVTAFSIHHFEMNRKFLITMACNSHMWGVLILSYDIRLHPVVLPLLILFLQNLIHSQCAGTEQCFLSWQC